MASHSKLIKLDRIIAILFSKRKEETKPRHVYVYPSLFRTLQRLNGLVHFRRSYRMEPESFRTLEGKFGINVQAICDHKYRFTWMSALATGSTHDSAAWGLTELYDQIGIIVPYYINGDAAYPASEVLLVPFKGIRLSKDKDAFNYFQSAVRIRIENSFGILRNRWLILKKPIQLNPLRVPMFVRVLMKLHNFIIDMEDPEPPLEAMSFRSSHVHMRPAERPHRRQKSSIREKITRDLAEAGLLRPGRS